ncbi:CRISPR-associated helicase Cas3' [Clostridium sp. WLY-B-L2]|uniref:CRISPR-associated helicase Cas3 n=1 Tax=Clostridium aromativorans TaxID=2836848 RepID=A0ABS8N581_9CLOT|nr:CRISPR-associated helicase Cas3' [Clostridium aromativorans]MCC9294954.1 CRISPR-associated helicase Cas3' [Clostridium aromativorans]
MINASDVIENLEKLYAHRDEDNVKIPELLVQHLDRTLYFFNKLCDEKNVDNVIYNILVNVEFDGQKLNEKCCDFIKELFVDALYFHDIGKINPAFQYVKMNNKLEFDDKEDGLDTKHSQLGALLFVHMYINKINEIDEDGIDGVQGFLRHILFSFAYVISRHHTYLDDLEKVDFYDTLENVYNRVKDKVSYIRYYKNSKDLIENFNMKLLNNSNRYGDGHSPYEIYILVKLLYSAIVTCDFYATSYYETSKEPNFNYINNVEEIFEIYKNTNIYKGIEKYKKDKNYFNDIPINALRTDMFLEAEKSLLKEQVVNNNNIFYLEAPTGSGKTNTSINLALNIIKSEPNINKIFYIFPFNTLVEQTKITLYNIFSEKFKIAVINSITPIITTQNDEDGMKDYKEDLLNRQMLQYPVILTTHVNFFNYLFGLGRESNLPLVHLCNSVIILDEIQSYRNSIWPEIIKLMDTYGKYLNMKIIIMSATLPKLDNLIKDVKSNFYELITCKDKYYNNKLFKNRVLLNFELLDCGLKDRNEIKENILNKINEVVTERKQSRILIEFIKKTTARDFYNTLREAYIEKRIVEITGDDSNYYRKKILAEINAKYSDDCKLGKKGELVLKDVIVVATQVIEAGVDIDMDVGFKDISLLDGEEQFLGRINRSCQRKNCIAYFFNYDKSETIYREDYRLEKDLMNIEYREFLINKDFQAFYNLCFQRLNEKKNKNNEESMKSLDKEVQSLNFKTVNERLKLITESNYQLFLAYTLEIEEDGESITIDGKELWQEYKKLYKNDEIGYAERTIKLSEFAQKISYFTYSYVDYSNKYDNKPKKYEDRMGNLFYVENGEDYMIEDEATGCKKFDIGKYQQDTGGPFL